MQSCRRAFTTTPNGSILKVVTYSSREICISICMIDKNELSSTYCTCTAHTFVQVYVERTLAALCCPGSSLDKMGIKKWWEKNSDGCGSEV
ncbi:hypothetical protein I7I53_04901 [Histoplasma capsulatum var. duboisii H88]|uniref:Uncharacterized protein n=1 Tax=Ajellomyces capsulatus (strain H88) TaxID=544711 RepID=A0A8A1LVR9_AJEC8|nr:hypothetical protein I7I53_04901 [Histoplasma capsulatum var. duboisii H88]